MATYVLVHGGGHGGWCYQRVARLLRSSGHEVYTPTLSGLGERSNLLSPGIDLDLHVRDVVAVLHYEDLHDVILVGHSYGGMVITGAADRAADRIGRVVYLDAANPENGQSLVDVAGPIIESTRPLGAVVDGVELVLLPSPEAGLFYGVTDPDDVAWMADRLTGHPWKCFEQPLRLTNQSAFAALPQYHIVCTSTLATRDPELMEKARADGRLWEIDTGHDLMITEPEAVTEALLQIAADVHVSRSPAPSRAGIDPLDLVDPERFAHRGYPHEVWTYLRAEAPVAFFEPPGYQPFWAITKHADITDITAQPVRFSNEHGLILGRMARAAQPTEMVVTLDPPRHGPLRRVGMRRFTPRAIRSRRTRSTASRPRCSTRRR